MSTLELEHLKHTSSSSNNLSVHSDGTVVSNNKLGIGAVPNATFGSLLYAQGTPAANKPIISGYSQGNSNNAGLALFNDTGNRGIWTGPGSSMRFTRSYEGNSTVDMNIDTSGRVTMPNQPLAVAYYSGASQDGAYAATNRSNVVCKPGATRINVGNLYNTSNGRFTAPVAGRYMAMFNGSQYTQNVVSYFLVRMLKNGGVEKDTYTNKTGTWHNISGYHLFDCAVNDYMEFFSAPDSTSATDRGGFDTNTYTNFIVYLLT